LRQHQRAGVQSSYVPIHTDLGVLLCRKKDCINPQKSPTQHEKRWAMSYEDLLFSVASFPIYPEGLIAGQIIIKKID
jgi:hypothetical protein